MTSAPSSWRRNLWRVGSTLVAAGSAVAVTALVTRRRPERASTDGAGAGTSTAGGARSPDPVALASRGTPAGLPVTGAPAPAGGGRAPGRLSRPGAQVPVPGGQPAPSEAAATASMPAPRPGPVRAPGDAAGPPPFAATGDPTGRPAPPRSGARTSSGPSPSGRPGSPDPSERSVPAAPAIGRPTGRRPASSPEGDADGGSGGDDAARGADGGAAEDSPGAAVAEAFAPREPGRARRRRPLVLGLAVIGVGLCAVVALAVTRDRGEPPLAAGEADRPATTSLASLSPDQAFTLAAERLTAGGAYGYHGTTSATDLSDVRPGPWMSVDVTVIGQVDLRTGRVHELLHSPDTEQVGESVTDGRTLWAHTAPVDGDLSAVPFEAVRQLAEPDDPPATTGAALLPRWLAASTDRRAVPPATSASSAGGSPGLAGSEGPSGPASTTGTGAPGEGPTGAGAESTTDGSAAPPAGGRTFRATLPAAVLGPIERDEPAVDAEIRLTLDASGAPVHVEVLTGPGGPRLHLSLTISGIGQPQPIELPSDQPGA